MKRLKQILLKTIILVVVTFVALLTIGWTWYLARINMQIIPIGYVNIKDLGAKGDGVTDDAPIIQLAENMGKSIYFPKGTYRLCSNLVKRNKVNWLGCGYDSIILINGAPYSYGSSNIVQNENYGIIDTARGISEEWDYGYKNTGKLDGFEFKNLTIKFRSSLKSGEQPESGYIHVFNFSHTNGVKITNVFMDSDINTNRGNCIFVFRGGNYNTTIENCNMIYDTNPSVLYGGSVVFASRSTSDPIQKVIIRNNTITKKNGGDEVLWFGANFNAINDVLIENNTIQAVSAGLTKASIIMFAQDSGEMLRSVSEPWNKIVIKNNNIVTNKINFSTIFVGYDFGTNSRKGGTVTISNNLINTLKSTSTGETVSGILVGRTKIVFIQNNTIIGNQDEGVTAEVEVGTVSDIANHITWK
jgi:hypothetical protein